MEKEQEIGVEIRDTEERLQDLIDDIRRNKIKACELISEEGKYNLADDIETVLNMLKEKDREIEKKDKIIDLMVKEINETVRGYIDYCQFKMVCDRNCKKCIKQYFERKVEE